VIKAIRFREDLKIESVEFTESSSAEEQLHILAALGLIPPDAPEKLTALSEIMHWDELELNGDTVKIVPVETMSPNTLHFIGEKQVTTFTNIGDWQS